VFVVLEGIDGSGKTEQTRRLAEWVRAQGREAVETREPTDGTWGRRYRSWARGEHEASADEVLRYFVEDRREHVDQLIRPALERGAVVVCDRYVASTLAYQAAQGVPRERLEAALGPHAFPEPDATLWLRLPVPEALARMGDTATERFERAAFLERVDAEYQALGLHPLPAMGSADEVALRLQALVAPHLSGS
jgi:dTMP kinase